MDDVITDGQQGGTGISDQLTAQAQKDAEGTVTADTTAGQNTQREQALEKELTEAKRKAEILDQMLDDDRFQKWLSDETVDDTVPQTGGRGAEQSVPNQQGEQPPDINDAFLKLRDKDPELADLFGKVFQAQNAQINTALGPKITELESNLRKTNMDADIARSTQEINNMRADKENYPMFEQVWSDMAGFLKAKRVGSLHDAYTLAVSSKVPLNRIAQKQAANMVAGKQGEMNTSIKNKIYKSPREAAQAAIAEMGWTPEGDF